MTLLEHSNSIRSREDFANAPGPCDKTYASQGPVPLVIGTATGVAAGLVAQRVVAPFLGKVLGRFVGSIAAESGAANAVNGVRLAQQLSAESMFNPAGGLSQEALAGSRQIIAAEDLGNPAIPVGFAKYTTDLFDTPVGPGQVHFYMNPSTREVWYGMDYKFIMQSGIGQ
jgi:hypothetical protein